MKVSVLGCGRWGSFLACYHSNNHEVMLWGMETSRSYKVLSETRKNNYIALPDSIVLSSDLKKTLEFSDYIVISISAQHLREFAKTLNEFDLNNKTFILCMKGLEAGSGKRLTEIMKEEITNSNINTVVWVGPGHVQSFMDGIPNCMVVDGENKEIVKNVVRDFNSELIRLYVGDDLVGTEIGAAAKNVIGIAAGMLDGKGLTSMKGSLMARGAREVARLIKAMGGNELSAYGLCHLGDYEATLFSNFSHNRMFGEKYIKGEEYTELAEGAQTVKALVKMAKEHNVELPISENIYNVLYCGMDPKESLNGLFARSTKGEFE